MWKIKVLIQFILAKLPGGEKINHLLQKLNGGYGEKNTTTRIIGITNTLAKLDQQIPLQNATIVEIGTGWIPICSVLLYLMGAKACHTYDHVRHIRDKLVKNFIEQVRSQLTEISEITSIPLNILQDRLSALDSSNDNLDDLFAKANIFYHAPGDATETGLADNSVDIVFSLAVLEHIPLQTIYALTKESKRILKKTGIAYHGIGLNDHYATFDKKITNVNFLKYSNTLWSFFVQNKISYHNRLREKQFISIFSECGAQVAWKENKILPHDLEALKNIKIHKDFQNMTHEELAVSGTQLVLTFL